MIHSKADKQVLAIRNAVIKEEQRKIEQQKIQDKKNQKIREAQANEKKIREANHKKANKTPVSKPKKTTVSKPKTISKKQQRKIDAEIWTKNFETRRKEKKIRFIGGLNIPPSMIANNQIAVNIVTSITIEWEDITFQDGFITAKHNGKLYEKFPVKDARKSLNVIKSHYKFRNAPKLILAINNYRIIKIENIEILFYYLQFLSNAGSLFPNYKVGSIPVGRYKIYTKSYYKKHFPDIFQSNCFRFLCEYAAIELPIIPVPEVVINKSGITQIDDSFLFPLVNRKNIYWLWESVEQSKATYLFQTLDLDFEIQLQIIFDYLTGNTINKRETLIRSQKFKQHLCFKTRIMHTDFNNWENEVKIYSGTASLELNNTI